MQNFKILSGRHGDLLLLQPPKISLVSPLAYESCHLPICQPSTFSLEPLPAPGAWGPISAHIWEAPPRGCNPTFASVVHVLIRCRIDTTDWQKVGHVALL